MKCVRCHLIDGHWWTSEIGRRLRCAQAWTEVWLDCQIPMNIFLMYDVLAHGHLSTCDLRDLSAQLTCLPNAIISMSCTCLYRMHHVRRQHEGVQKHQSKKFTLAMIEVRPAAWRSLRVLLLYYPVDWQPGRLATEHTQTGLIS